MKTFKISKYILAIAFALLTVNSCTEKYDEMNTNPALVTAELVNPDMILTFVQANAIVRGASYGNGTIGGYSGMDVRSDDRPFREGDDPGPWNSAYGSYLNNISNIITLTEKDPLLVNKKAIARIMKAWLFSRLTDTYGDVPYFESVLPLEKAVFAPKYDTQKSIYEDLFKELREAAAELDATKVSYGNADLVYKGNVEKWKKLANSLRLRLSLRVRFADPALAQSGLSDLTEADLITTRSDDAYVRNNTAYPSDQNPRYNRLANSGPAESVFIGKTLLDILVNNHSPLDPRIRIYADTALAAFPGTAGYEAVDYFGYRGQPLLGMVPVENKYPYQANTISQISNLWRVPVIELSIMKSSEVYFALAEARLFNLITFGDANTFYQKGIDAGIQWAQDFYNLVKPQLPATMKLVYTNWTDASVTQYVDYVALKTSEINAFKAAPVYTLAGTQEEQFEKIINQKLVAFYPEEIEAWSEWRRTGYPRVLVGPDADDLRGQIPRRLPWPSSEELLNSENFQVALTRAGGSDTRLVKVWWDANPAAPHAHPGTVEWQASPWIK